MTPKAADPSRYKLHVVSFSVVREAAPEDQPRPKLNDPNDDHCEVGGAKN